MRCDRRPLGVIDGQLNEIVTRFQFRQSEINDILQPGVNLQFDASRTAGDISDFANSERAKTLTQINRNIQQAFKHVEPISSDSFIPEDTDEETLLAELQLEVAKADFWQALGMDSFDWKHAQRRFFIGKPRSMVSNASAPALRTRLAEQGFVPIRHLVKQKGTRKGEPIYGLNIKWAKRTNSFQQRHQNMIDNRSILFDELQNRYAWSVRAVEYEETDCGRRNVVIDFRNRQATAPSLRRNQIGVVENQIRLV